VFYANVGEHEEDVAGAFLEHPDTLVCAHISMCAY
jgi:hypothetical protein